MSEPMTPELDALFALPKIDAWLATLKPDATCGRPGAAADCLITRYARKHHKVCDVHSFAGVLTHHLRAADSREYAMPKPLRDLAIAFDMLTVSPGRRTIPAGEARQLVQRLMAEVTA